MLTKVYDLNKLDGVPALHMLSMFLGDNHHKLFELLPQLPPGFLYFPDFINEQQESHLIRQIQNYPLKKMIFHGYEANRKVLSFGYDYDFVSRTLSQG